MNPEAERYAAAHSSPEPEHLYELWRATNLELHNGRMCSGHLQGRLLKMLVRMAAPERIVELGTFSGYSALCLAEGLSDGAILDTIEVDDELEDFIRRALASSPHGHKVRLHIGEAIPTATALAQRDGRYDMAFVDADKREYPAYYRLCKKILKPGGYILADNTLWDGHVAEADRMDAQTRGIKEFNEMVAADQDVEAVMLPLRDGLTLIRLKPEGE